jgi:hypothetical protein
MKIALLFILIDNPNFTNIYDKWLKNVNKNKYSIYIHSKYPDKLTWNKDRLIENLVETAWGKITNAEYQLIKAALIDKNNSFFIILSESCVPITTFDIFYNFIKHTNKSIVKIMKMSNYDYNERILNHIKTIKNGYKPNPKKMIKHYSRFCLKRNDAQRLINVNPEKLEFYNNMPISDEFWLSLIYPFDSHKDFEITFDDWDYVKDEIKKINNLIKESYEIQETTGKIMTDEIKTLQTLKQTIAKNPKMITNVKPDLNKIKNCKSYFYRKFSKESDIDLYINEIWLYRTKYL